MLRILAPMRFATFSMTLRLCRTIFRFHKPNVALFSTKTFFLCRTLSRTCSRCSAQVLGSLSKNAPCVATLIAMLSRKLRCSVSSSSSSACSPSDDAVQHPNTLVPRICRWQNSINDGNQLFFQDLEICKLLKDPRFLLAAIIHR